MDKVLSLLNHKNIVEKYPCIHVIWMAVSFADKSYKYLRNLVICTENQGNSCTYCFPPDDMYNKQ